MENKKTFNKRRGMYEEDFDEIDDVSNQIQKQAMKARSIQPDEPAEQKDFDDAIDEERGSDMEFGSETEPELMMTDDDDDDGVDGLDFEVTSVKSFNSDRSKVQLLDPVYALGPQTSASAVLDEAKSAEKEATPLSARANDENPQASVMLESGKYIARIRELPPNRVFDIRSQLNELRPDPNNEIGPQLNGRAIGLPPNPVFNIRPQMNGRAIRVLPDPVVNNPPKPNGSAIGLPLLNIRPQLNGNPRSNGLQPNPVVYIPPQLSPRAIALRSQLRESIRSKNAAPPPTQGIEAIQQSTDNEDSDSDCSGRHNTGDNAEEGRARQYAELLELHRYTPPPFHNFEFDVGSGANFGLPIFGNCMNKFLTALSVLAFVGAALFLVIFLKKIFPKL